MKSKFSNPLYPKDKFVLSDCKEAEVRGVLEFQVPITYLEKPIWITITVVNTIYWCFVGRKACRLGYFDPRCGSETSLSKLVVGKSESFSLCPSLFHLYHNLELMKDRETVTYKVTKVMTKYNIILELEP